MSQPKRGRSSQAQNHLITILLALVIAGLSMWFGAGRDRGNAPDAAATPMPGSGLTVTYLDVGQGDCTLLQCDGQTMLIDAGIGLSQANHITTYLKQQGVKSIDYLVCTHAHADHCGGMEGRHRGLPGAHVLQLRHLEQQRRVPARHARGGDGESRHHRAGRGRHLRPRRRDRDRARPAKALQRRQRPEPHSARGLRQQRLPLHGDAEYQSETDVLDAGENVRCDVIKAGHHGSRTSTGYRLLYEAQPRYAVISCGAGNEYGHPHDDTLSRLRDADVTVYRTDLNGTVVCRSDGTNLTFTTEKEG